MRELLPLTPAPLARAEELPRNPPPGSRIEAAQEYGIDSMQLMEQLQLTPDERDRKREAAAKELEPLRGIALKAALSPYWPLTRRTCRLFGTP